MRKTILLAVPLVFVCALSIAQIEYEKGYFVNNSGERTECLIRNADWRNNPTEFKYKIGETDTDIKRATIDSVSEFGTHDGMKYIRAMVNIDRSDEKSQQRQPSFSPETLFLKVLVEGKANLYRYSDGNLQRFFYKQGSSDIEQLIFKQFLVSEAGRPVLADNLTYKQTLLSNLNCGGVTAESLRSMEYRETHLTDYFKKYNQCTDPKPALTSEKKSRDVFNFRLTTGMDMASLNIKSSLTGRAIDFGSSMGVRLGVEGEFILPYNKNKWQILVAPSFQSVSFEAQSGNDDAKTKYRSIELPLGIRHYFFINDNSRIFLNAAWVPELKLKSHVALSKNTSLEIKSKANLSLGAGAEIRTFSIELRYYTSRQILANYEYWSTDFSKLSLIAGWRIF